MRKIASLEDLIGLDHGKIGHYEALQMNMPKPVLEHHQRTICTEPCRDPEPSLMDSLTSCWY